MEGGFIDQASNIWGNKNYNWMTIRVTIGCRKYHSEYEKNNFRSTRLKMKK